MAAPIQNTDAANKARKTGDAAGRGSMMEYIIMCRRHIIVRASAAPAQLALL